MKRLLIFIHRYLGIPLSIVFVVWFVSGIVMMYTGGMPSVSADDALARRAPLDAGAVVLSPQTALDAADVVASPTSIRLQTVLGRPAYRFGFGFGFGGEMTVFADTGAVLDGVSERAAAAIAADWLGLSAERVEFVATHHEPDQWTLTLRSDLPLHEFAVADGNATRAYVASQTGDVVLVTTRASRFFAWIGVIPHWFYFTPLRMNQPLWYWTVVGVSALGCLLAAIGLVLGVTQFRRSQPFSLAKSVRYRGLMRWHYLTGVFFGVFALTWVFSGLMSMEPFAWTNVNGLEIPRAALTGGPLRADAYPALAAVSPSLGVDGAAEIGFVRALGEPYLLVTRAPAAAKHVGGAPSSPVRERLHQPYPVALDARDGRYLVHADDFSASNEPFAPERLVAAIERSAAGAAVTAAELLEHYDSYYYSRNGDAPLPVLRVKFDDPLETWYYIDPAEARIVARTHRFSRIERWLFDGLHSLDFGFWYDKRPLWDIGMIALSLGALLTSAIGMWLGVRRLSGRSGARAGGTD